MPIPVVIFHVGGNQPYFINCVNISSQKNMVYLVGDDSNKRTFVNNQNVLFFHVDDLSSKEADDFKHCFVNYSTNDQHFEMYCFLRVFYMKTLFEKTQDSRMFHTDSDCVILESVSNLFSESDAVTSYFIEKSTNKYHMVGSIHNALIDIHFCNKFIQLCFDVYGNRTKSHLIDEKIQWHQNTGMPGGICDMTLYYLLYSEKRIDNIVDLNIPISQNGEDVVFGDYILGSNGYGGYVFETHDEIKTVVKTERGCYFKTVDGRLIKTASIHFNCNTKYLLEQFSV
jgi:hypothetical protein